MLTFSNRIIASQPKKTCRSDRERHPLTENSQLPYPVSVDTSLLHPELRKGVMRFPSAPIGRPSQIRMLRTLMRLLPSQKPPEGVRRDWVELAQGVGVHVFTPDDGGNGAALLWIHGGGMVIGAAKQDHARCGRLAAELGIVVVSVEYRLAPEHPYPEPLDDCGTAWGWLLEHAASRGIDTDRLAIGGQSAGGGLAAGLALRIRDEGGPQPVAQWLYCPMLDDRTATDRSLDAIEHFVWDNRKNLVGWTAYLGEPGGHSVPAYAAPARREDLTGLPPTWIGAGGIELFRDEDIAYADALAAAGVDVVLDLVAGAPHAFETLVPKAPVSVAYVARANGWLAARLGLDAPDAPAHRPD